MTLREITAVARTIARERRYQMEEDVRCVAAVDLLAERLADLFATFNPRFDRAAFLAACR